MEAKKKQTRVSLDLLVPIHKRIKIHAAKHGLTLKSAITTAILEYLDKRKNETTR